MGKLPDFVIIGCMKGGTSTLHHHLKQHPDIFMPEKKELHFFIAEWEKGVDWYKSFFGKGNDSRICGEATPAYIYFTQYHSRMFDTIPRAKLVLALRDPVTRAFSQWNHQREKWYDNRSFEEVIHQDMRNLKRKDHTHCYEDLLQRGFYIEQVENLLKYYPRESLHILISERMKRNFRHELNGVLNFLGLYKEKKLSQKILRILGLRDDKIQILEGIYSRSYQEPMKEETARLLQEIYEPYNERLFQFLGYKVEEWNINNQSKLLE